MKTIAALAAALCLAAPLSAQKASKPAGLKAANMNFSFKDLTGKKVSLSAFKGKVIILDFWATWCVPCKAEIPGFIALQKTYGGKGLQVIGLSVDDSMAMAKKYADEIKMNYPVLLAEGKQDILEAYDPIPSIPVSIIIDREGRIVTRHLGIAAMDVFEQEISPLL